MDSRGSSNSFNVGDVFPDEYVNGGVSSCEDSIASESSTTGGEERCLSSANDADIAVLIAMQALVCV